MALVFYISKGIIITQTEVLDGNHIAVEMKVGDVQLAGAVEFDGVMLEGKPETLKVTVTVAVTAILNGPYSIRQLSDATGSLLTNKVHIANVLTEAWDNNFFPYPG